MRFFFRLTSLSVLFVFLASAGFCQGEHTSLVNPFIGTGGHGHTYPGACVPFGMVQLSPDTRLEGWDGCSGYYYADTEIYGFSHTHLSGTGVSDYGDILLMPATDKVSLKDYASRSGFSHEKENAKPGYYSVLLNSGILAELTATERTGMHRYSFPADANPSLVIDLKHRDEVIESSLKLLNDSTLVGYRRSSAWATDQRLWFAIVFQTKVQQILISKDDNNPKPSKSAKGNNLRALLQFKALTNGKLLVKVGLSPVSSEGALQNLNAENSGWDFDKVVKNADQQWEAELSKIQVTGENEEQRIIFYTALYHAFMNPNLYNDHNGDYRGRDFNVHQAPGQNYYTVFSLWDTYRAAHPLYVLTQQKRSVDFIKTFIAQYEQGGLLPVWELSSNETFCMIGYHAVPVIADAYIKGLKDFDAEKALEAMINSANQNHHGLDAYKKQGFIASTDASESVSKTLEYAYDDWCIAQMALKMGKMDVYQTFIQRAQSYKNLFDPSTGFMRARTNGGWFQPFDPAEVNFNYTEANAWQYSFYVPQDIQGWLNLLGGKQQLAKFLDALFEAESRTTGREQADITGLIGQYAHGNEPSHHMTYLYNYVGQAWKTQKIVHELQYKMYSNAPDGLCGNEDCGQMSSWFVLSSLGFYPVTPASEIYMIGTPLFEHATIYLENGNTFDIRANNISPKTPYIQSVTLNGSPLERPWLTHEELINGGILKFEMGHEPNMQWGLIDDKTPIPSAINDHLITPVPFVENGNYVFTDSTLIRLSDIAKDAVIHYTTNGNTPDDNAAVYSTPFVVKETTNLQMIAIQPGCTPSNVVHATFSKIEAGRSLSILNAYAPAYAAGGDQALIDYVYGQTDFRTGAWQGYEGVNLDVILDLGKVQTVNAISIRFLQDMRSWIFMPETVDFTISTNGKDFSPIGSIKTVTPQEKAEGCIETFRIKGKPMQARYIHIVGQNAGECPYWHPGAGKKSWVFADEITIE